MFGMEEKRGKENEGNENIETKWSSCDWKRKDKRKKMESGMKNSLEG